MMEIQTHLVAILIIMTGIACNISTKVRWQVKFFFLKTLPRLLYVITTQLLLLNIGVIGEGVAHASVSTLPRTLLDQYNREIHCVRVVNDKCNVKNHA